ncbi:MAG: FAD-dependent monooxygenase, partial [Candidatus Limnocylindrales bacterium]
MEHVEALVVGGGQAGLAVSHELTSHGVEHVVLERGRIGQSWRDRWDSFCLVRRTGPSSFRTARTTGCWRPRCLMTIRQDCVGTCRQ